MKIGELSKKCSIASSAIRYYESKGLLKSIPRKSNGYREYPEDAVLLLSIITSAQLAGFTLDEIKQLLPPNFNNWEHDSLLKTINKKMSDIEKLENKLKKIKFNLKEVLKGIEQKPANLSCADNAKQLIERFNKKKNHHA